jgi:valyl-tRNA synthetase
MPFITEELWHQLPRVNRELSISLASFRLVSDRAADPVSEKQFQAIEELVVAARNAKAEVGVQKQRPAVQVASEDLRILELFREHQETILRLAGLGALNFMRGRLVLQGGTGGVRRVNAALDLRIFHEQQVDVEAERARLERQKSRIEQQMVQLKGQLDNDGFRRRAPQDVVRAAEHRLVELTEHYRKVVESLERLGTRET